MNIRPIRTEADYDAALAEIDRLIDAPDDSLEADYLDILSTLVEAYEEQHYPIPLPDPISYILYYMESRGLTRRDLEPYLGSQRRVAQVLNKERPLTMKMIRALNRGLNIAMDILVQPVELLPSQKRGSRVEASHWAMSNYPDYSRFEPRAEL